jgi:hypothetical protein
MVSIGKESFRGETLIWKAMLKGLDELWPAVPRLRNECFQPRIVVFNHHDRVFAPVADLLQRFITPQG